MKMWIISVEPMPSMISMPVALLEHLPGPSGSASLRTAFLQTAQVSRPLASLRICR